MTRRTVEIEYVRFAVGDRPVCVWAPGLAQTNLRFLRGLDPEFFIYQANAHQQALEPRDEGDPTARATYAALALRLNYGMAVETLFAILCAMVQAPDCVFGWLDNYKTHELKAVVSQISSGSLNYALSPFVPATWEHLSATLLTQIPEQTLRGYPELAALFARAWRTFAADFLNEGSSREYNSLKHSFRVQPGQVAFDISHEGTSILRSESRFAHSFPYLRAIPSKKRHHNVSHAVSALEPAACSAALCVIALSINNAVAFLRDRAGDAESNLVVRFPTDLRLFEEIWKPRSPISALTYGGSVILEDEKYLSDEEILATYDEPEGAEV